MQILKFLNQEYDTSKNQRLLFMSAVSGMANALLLAIINSAARAAYDQDVQSHYFVLYFLTITLFIYTKKYTLAQSTIIMEEIIRKVRMRIASKLRLTELQFIENTGRSEIYTRLSEDTVLISQATPNLVSAGQSAVMIVFSSLYLAWLSTAGFVLTLIFTLTGILVFLNQEKTFTHDFEIATTKEEEFFTGLNDLLDGFKEIKLNRQKGEELLVHLDGISDETKLHKVSAGLKGVFLIVFADVFFYILIALIVFVTPILTPGHNELAIKGTTTILFLMGPIGMIVGIVPILARIEVAVGRIYHLEESLDEASHGRNTEQLAEPLPLAFQEVRFQEVVFQYTDKEGQSSFTTGPLNLSIKRGEILFIVGGNGSGKSTLLKLLVGLYYPFSGMITLDGEEEIDKTNYQAYRELFSIIFTDFHIFNRLYGLPTLDGRKIKEFLKLMELDKKTKYLDGKFTDTNLSTGQKKRLAFIAAVLEDKPIYVFDEWAADQDPQFRKYFYEVLLPNLRDQNKTIVAVTHDDKYFSTADRVLKMEYGKLISYDS